MGISDKAKEQPTAAETGRDDDLIKVAVESTETEVTRKDGESRLRFRGDIEGLRGVAIGIGVVGHLLKD